MNKRIKLTGGGYFCELTNQNRSSNLELLRIVAMITIIAHHYVVNSGITDMFDYSNVTANMIFLQLWGMWGKTAINVFVMITGYFMCEKRLTMKRFAKIYLEAKFYRLVIFMIMLMCGYETLAPKNLFKALFGCAYGIGHSFTASFLMFYLFIPFYNILLDKLDRRQHIKLVLMLLAAYTGTATFFFCSSVFSEPVWYMVLYFAAAYIKRYEAGTWLRNNKVIASWLAVVIGMAYLSVLAVDFIGNRFGFRNWSYMVSDSNKLFAFLIGSGMFLLFHNMNIRYSRGINTIAASTFGVLCIHASSDAMRTWLWKETLDVSGMYSAPLGSLVVHAVLSLAAIYIVCTAIDYLRIRFIEKSLFQWLGRFEWFGMEL